VQESTHFSCKRVPIVIISEGLLILSSLMKGAKGAKSIVGFEECGVAYFMVNLVYIIVQGCVWYYSCNLVKKDNEKKVKAGYKFHETDI
jgi:hypothetical protein